jgi:phospholipid/cholesterol/gamma-HCH transport system ATP-binding protein
MHTEPVIEVDKLVVQHGDQVILKGIDLTIRQSEIMVIMGASGSGKSTLLRSMLGLNRPKSGTIKLLGKNIYTISLQELYELRRQIGVAFQNGALLGSLSVGENVRLPLQEHTKLDKKTMAIMTRMKLEVVNLSGFEHLMPSELSGGMVKRTALARAVIMDPKMLFFDEPSAGLDPIVAAEIDELILLLRQAMNITVVVVTHELVSAFNIADRITVLDQGEVLLTGTVEEIRESDNERIQNLLHRRPRREVIDADKYLQHLIGETQ